MKKISSFLSVLMVITFAFISCSKESATQNEEKGYKINIHATNGAGTKVVTDDGSKGVTTFASTEKIYVCNQSSGNKIDATAISPTPESIKSSFSQRIMPRRFYPISNKVMFGLITQRLVISV